MDPLNPDLYNSLVSRFGEVRVCNEGQPMLTRRVRSMFDYNKYDDVPVEAGEQYCVCCPYCGDRRFRLYISYRWNTKDRRGKPFGRHMIQCFNENCDTSKFRDHLQTYLSKYVEERPYHSELRKAEATFTPIDLPGLCIPLHSLPHTHPARMYLHGRNFDPDELSKLWNVHYCMSAAVDENGFIPGTRTHAHLVMNRLIFPAYRAGAMVGFQARALGPHQIKYYTMPGFSKQYMLYNGDRAKDYDFGVVVEGVLDAIRVGPQAVALLGKHMSWRQRELIVAYWGSGALCILLDPDAVKETERIQRMINPQSFRWGSFCLPLQPGTDPGDMDRDTLWSLIASYARTRNVQIAAI
jgi:hypothetical protein